MKSIVILALIAAPVAAQPRTYPPKGSAEQRANYERGQDGQIAFEQQLFVDAGFQPLSSVGASKRAVKRVLFQDPYIMLPVPGVEIEQAANGLITLKTIGRGGESAPVALPKFAWSRLSTLQGDLFRRKPYVPWDPPKADASAPPPPPICHGWLVRFGSMDFKGAGSGSWAACGGENQPEAAYATEVARLAVSTRPSCKFEESNPFWSFSTCFSPPPRS